MRCNPVPDLRTGYALDFFAYQRLNPIDPIKMSTLAKNKRIDVTPTRHIDASL